MEDYYSILGVPPTATLATIRESYRRLALKFHPDKNRNDGATANFQRLARAWEVMQDRERRADYDRDFFVRGSKRKNEGSREDDWRAKMRREEVDPNVQAWANGMYEDHESRMSREARREKCRAWKALALSEYLPRLKVWTDLRRQLVPRVFAYEQSIRSQQAKLDSLENISECDVLLQFQQAIRLSHSAGELIEDPAETLSRLMSAREKFMAKLSQTLSHSHEQYGQLLRELAINQRRFEEQEIDKHQSRVQKALEILGPRGLNPPVLIDVDPRCRAINRWESLTRVKSARNFSYPSQGLSEGPWHSSGEWERISGEHCCSRCEKVDFHVIAECGPAKCPGCAAVVCNECHRDLWLLRKYSEWIVSPNDGPDGGIFFSLDV